MPYYSTKLKMDKVSKKSKSEKDKIKENLEKLKKHKASPAHIKEMKKQIKLGKSFNEAHNIALKKEKRKTNL
jgi:hypothetical protein